MENASKALLIAGGMLLAIILISLFLNMYNKMSNFQRTQEEQKEAKQIQEFNAGYEAYDKRIMYGTDIITLVHKAIENNKTKNATTGKINCINITLTVNQSYGARVVIEDLSGKYEEEVYTGERAVEEAGRLGISLSGMVFNEGRTYSLGKWVNGIKEEDLDMNPDIIKWFEAWSEDKVEKKTTRDGTKIYYIYSALTNFKTSRFKCTNVDYDSNGRIKEMNFEEY